MAKKSAGTAKESLVKELKSLIPQLDEEGLAFLLEQARIHLYNMQVDRLNTASEDLNSAAARSRAVQKAGIKAPAKFSISGTESGSSYYLRYGNDNIMFSAEEMLQMVKIVNGAGSDPEIRERLYNWFDRERRDIFSLVNMRDKFDERLKAMIALFKKSFKMRGH